jgi:hypothetical protein
MTRTSYFDVMLMMMMSADDVLDQHAKLDIL